MICKRILLVVGIIIPLSVLAQTKEECIADKMEGVADDCAAAARRFCERYPEICENNSSAEETTTQTCITTRYNEAVRECSKE